MHRARALPHASASAATNGLVLSQRDAVDVALDERHQPELGSAPGRVAAAGDSELAEDGGDVMLGGSRRDDQPLGDLRCLSARQLEVLALLAGALTNAEIAFPSGAQARREERCDWAGSSSLSPRSPFRWRTQITGARQLQNAAALPRGPTIVLSDHVRAQSRRSPRFVSTIAVGFAESAPHTRRQSVQRLHPRRPDLTTG